MILSTFIMRKIDISSIMNCQMNMSYETSEQNAVRTYWLISFYVNLRFIHSDKCFP